MPEWIDTFQFIYAPQVVNGLSLGMAVILMALGLTIIFGLLDVINMAHGECYALGAYLGLTLLTMGMSFWFVLVLVPLIMLPIGYLIERALIQRVYHHKDRHILTLLLTFGLAIILEDLFKVIYGPNAQRPETPISGATELFGMLFPAYRVFLMALGVLIVAGIWWAVYRTRWGAVVRAASWDRDMAASLGVPVLRVYAWTFAFGVALAGLAGVLLAPVYSVFPTMGKDFILTAFTVVIVGGLGSIKGAIAAGLLLTQVQALSSLHISPVWSEPLVFGVMVLVLMFRPQGLFGKLGNG